MLTFGSAVMVCGRYSGDVLLALDFDESLDGKGHTGCSELMRLEGRTAAFGTCIDSDWGCVVCILTNII
jgi:hypothetical protein